MKRFLTIQAFFLGSFFILASCYKDKGNYDINPVGEILLGGKSYNAENYNLQQYDTLKVDAAYTYTGKDTSILKFKWSIMPINAKPNDTTIVDISTDRNLRYEVVNRVGDYTLRLSIEDPSSTVVRSKMFGVKIRPKGASGFMVLYQNGDSFQDIDVIVDNTKPEVVRDLYSTTNSTQLSGAHKLTYIMNFANIAGYVYVLQKDGGQLLNDKYQLLQQATAWFDATPSKIAPTHIHQDPGLGQNVYFINNGKVHWPNGIRMPFIFFHYASGDYNVSKALFMGTYAFIYDDKNHRFMRFDKASGSVNPFTANPEDKFPLGNIGNKGCFYFDHNAALGTAANANLKPVAYCRDNVTGQVYAYRLGFFPKLATYAESVKEITEQSFKEGTAYVNAINNPLTYYAYQNKLYLYDINNNTHRLIYTFERQDIRIDVLKTNGTQLVAGVNATDKAEGEVYFFKIDGTGSVVGNTYLSKYDCFGKVQDIEMKFNSGGLMGPYWK